MPGFWCFTFDFVTPAPVNRKSPAVKKKTLLKKISKASSEKENIKLGSEGMAKIQDSTLVSSSPEPTGHAAMEHLTNVPSLPKLQGQQDPDSMARARTAAPDLNNQIYSDMLAGAHLGPGIICISKSDTIKLMGERATELDFTSRPHIERTILSDRPTTSVIEANKANLKWLKWSAMQLRKPPSERFRLHPGLIPQDPNSKIPPKPFRLPPLTFLAVRNRLNSYLVHLHYLLYPGLRHRFQARIYRFVSALRQGGNHRNIWPQISSRSRFIGKGPRRGQWGRAGGGVTGARQTTSKSSISHSPTTRKSTQRKIMQKQNEPTSEGGGWLSSTYQSLGYGSSGSNGGTDSPGKKEGGGRREKLASYIRAANEIRQSYYPSRNTTAPGVSRWNAAYEDSAYETPSNQELMEYVANGKEEIMLFPTYGRTGIKEFRRDSGESEPVLKSAEVPVVEVNVRGWIYTPHTALPPSRKNRFAMAAVAKLCGVPNIDGSQDNTSASEEILGAARVVEVPDSSTSSNENSGAGSKLAWIASKYGLHGQTPTQQSPSTPPPTDVRELSNALRTRLSPFLTTPSFHMPLTVFFYNPKTAQSTTTRTDSLGHFAIRKSLPFTPTHIRVLAGENLCAEDRISYIDAGTGISLISDIDDTIKVSGIGTGLREMFRNVFIREISTMPVPGVAEWFRELSQPPLNVQIHYLSNSPWQLFPFLKELLVGHMNLPLGTWHLKKYSGFIQGIFEPVIERKKESLEGLLTSFPGRKWILVGDGGEGDLEAYTDVVKRWPGHVIAVYIRDVSGIGEEVVGPGAGAHSNTTEYFDGNTSRDGLNSLNFGKWAPEEAQKAPSEHLIDLHSHSLSRSGSDLSGRFGNIGPEIHPANRASTWGGDFSTAVKKTPGDPVKFTPPPVPSKPRELRGTPITSPATDGSDKGNIIRHSSASQKIDSYESLPGASEPTVAMHDGGKYRPSSATPPSIHLGRGTGTSSSTSSIKYGSPPAHVPSNYSSTVSLPPLQSTTSQQISANSSQRPLDKKAELWKKRWEYASELLAEQGVVLRSWKVGHDVHAESVDLVKGLLNEQNRGTNNPEK